MVNVYYNGHYNKYMGLAIFLQGEVAMNQGKLQLRYLEETYEELTRLGDKPEGVTWLVRHRSTGKIVVKKQVLAQAAHVYEQLMKLAVPNLAKIYSVCSDGERCMVLEEYISGETVGELMEREGAVASEDVHGIVRQLLTALAHIHGQGIVHRDLTPDNIMISGDGVVKLIDFGIAREAKENQRKDTMILGTVGYASPEQFGFTQTDCRTDIYAIGVLMNKMLTGKMPDEEIAQVSGYGPIIRKCIQLDPEKRFQSVRELAEALDSVHILTQAGKVTADVSYAGQGAYGMHESKNIGQPEVKRSAIPGFRDGMRRHRIYAIVGYSFAIIMQITQLEKCKGNLLAFCLEFLSWFGIVWIPVALIGDVADWSKKVPFFRKLSKDASMSVRMILSITIFYFSISLENYVSYTLLGLPRPT